MNQNGKQENTMQPIEEQVSSMLDEFLQGAAGLPEVPEDLDKGSRSQEPEPEPEPEPETKPEASNESETSDETEGQQEHKPSGEQSNEPDDYPDEYSQDDEVPAIVSEIRAELEELREQNKALLEKLNSVVGQQGEPYAPPALDSLTVVPDDADINDLLTPEGMNEFATKVANAAYQKAVATAVSQVSKAVPRYVGMVISMDRFLQRNPDIRNVKDYFVQQVVEAQKASPGIAFERILENAANRTRKALNLRPNKPKKPAAAPKPPARQPEPPKQKEDPFQQEVDQMLKALT